MGEVQGNQLIMFYYTRHDNTNADSRIVIFQRDKCTVQEENSGHAEGSRHEYVTLSILTCFHDVISKTKC